MAHNQRQRQSSHVVGGGRRWPNSAQQEIRQETSRDCLGQAFAGHALPDEAEKIRLAKEISRGAATQLYLIRCGEYVKIGSSSNSDNVLVRHCGADYSTVKKCRSATQTKTLILGSRKT